MTAAFADNLRRELTAVPAPAPEGDAAAAPAPSHPEVPAAKPIGGLRLLLRAVLGQLRARFQRDQAAR
jgi:hypothetical protein